MPGDQNGGAPKRQDVMPGGDVDVAESDSIMNVNAPGAQGVQVGGPGAVLNQVNNFFGQAAAEVAQATMAEFRADLLTLVDRVDEDAVRRGLPERLVPGGDVLRMTRTVRLLGAVRRSPKPDGQLPRMDLPDEDRHRAYALAAERDDRGGEPPRSWQEVAAEHDRLVVLGDPGMGKSWLLRAQAHRLAGAARQDVTASADGTALPPIPVLVRAGVLAGLPGRTLAEAVSGHLVAEGWLPARSAGRMRDLIDSGGVVLLVDALDEIPARDTGPGSPQRVAGLLRRWAESCTGTARCVVTSRLAGYAGPPVHGAREAELLPFTPKDVRCAAEAWDLPGDGAAQLKEWLAQPAVAAMARVPLLLALLCSLAADPCRREPLPRARAELYRAVVWQFLSSAHRSGGPDGTAQAVAEADQHALLSALTRVAFTFAETSQGWVDQMPYQDLAKALRGPRDTLGALGDTAMVLDRLVTQAGVLVPAGSPAVDEQDYLFLHRTIAEYLVARHLADLPADERMRVVAAHQWFDPDWAEVIPMLGTLLATRNLPEAQALVTHFLTAQPDPLNRAFDTALRIICEAPDPDSLLTPATGKQVHDRLRRLVRRDPNGRLIRTLATAPAWPRAITSAMLALATDRNASLRLVAMGVLARRGEAEATTALLTLATVTATAGYVRRAAVRALADQEGAEATTTLLTLTTDGDILVRRNLAEALAGREAAEVTTALLTLTTDASRYVRRAAVRALANRGGAEVTNALLTLTTDRDMSVRRTVAEALAGREGAEVTTALLTLATDIDFSVSEAAAQALADREGAEVTTALLTLTTDIDIEKRSAAAQALAHREGAEVTTALLTLATGSDRYVRGAATRALADREGTEVTNALLTLTADGDVDDAAAQALAGREGDEVTSALLALTTDSDRFRRRAAALALAGREGDEVTSTLLALTTDSVSYVRGAAAHALAGREGDGVTSALLALAPDYYEHVREEAAQALARRRDPVILERLCRRWRVYEPPALRRERRDLADKVADQLYVLLRPQARPRVLRRLGKLTR